MENKLEIFASNEFGSLRTLECDGKVMFVASDVAKMLGYTNTSKAISDHCPHVTKRYIGVQTGLKADGTPAMQNVQVSIIPEGDVYRLITHSKLPTAERFESWVFDEVLPSIRKTGSYIVKPVASDKELDIRLKEINAKQAEIYLQIADTVQIPEYKQIMNSLAVEVMSGEKYLPLPTVSEKTYSATDIGNLLGVSANKIGRLAKQYSMKTTEYGKFFYDKAKHSSKEVETFRYYDKAIGKFKALLAV